MKLLTVILCSLGIAAVSALPAVVLDDAASNAHDLTMRSGGAGGFEDYIIVPGPTGVDLAGAIQEIPGYGVSTPLALGYMSDKVATDLTNVLTFWNPFAQNQNTLAQGQNTCLAIPNCIAVISSGGYVSVNAANLDGSGVTGLGDASLSWR